MGRTPQATDRVAAGIRTAITVGRWLPGQWLPSTTVLAEEFGVSRAPVIGALRKLEERGIIEIHRNKGAKVVERQGMITRTVDDILVGVDHWRGFPAAVYTAGGTPFNDLTSSAEIPAPPDAAIRLGIPAGATVYERVRVQGFVELGRKVPAQLAWSWFTMGVVERVPAIRATPSTGPSRVRPAVAAAGYAIRFEHMVEARHADAMERALLELVDPAPVLEVWRLCVDDGTGEPIEVTKMIDDARRVRLRY